MDEEGDLALARLTPDGLIVLARTSLFETVAWTAPTLYVRDREKIVVLDLAPIDRTFVATHVCAR